MWANAAVGLGTGALTGFLSHRFAILGNRRGWWRLSLNNNTVLLATMLTGAAGSFVGAYSVGMNEIGRLHPIFRRGQQSSSMQDHDDFADPNIDDPVNRSSRERNRIFRRATVEQSFQSNGGLGDSHGGHWWKDDDSA